MKKLIWIAMIIGLLSTPAWGWQQSMEEWLMEYGYIQPRVPIVPQPPQVIVVEPPPVVIHHYQTIKVYIEPVEPHPDYIDFIDNRLNDALDRRRYYSR